MEARELRIGNWARYVKGVAFYGGDETEIGYRDLENSEMFEPIPLTEEWVIKLGLIEGDFVKLEKNEAFLIDVSTETVWIGDVTDFEYSAGVHCKYVHQLQNLYYALTSEELVIQSK